MRYDIDWVRHWARLWGSCLINWSRKICQKCSLQHFMYWVLDGIKSELSSIHSSPPASWFVGVLRAAVSSSVCCHDFPSSRWTVPSNCEPFLHIAFFPGYFIAAYLIEEEGTTSPLNGSAANGLLNNCIVAVSTPSLCLVHHFILFMWQSCFLRFFHGSYYGLSPPNTKNLHGGCCEVILLYMVNMYCSHG